MLELKSYIGCSVIHNKTFEIVMNSYLLHILVDKQSLIKFAVLYFLGIWCFFQTSFFSTINVNRGGNHRLENDPAILNKYDD